jgi:hypothetical protein
VAFAEADIVTLAKQSYIDALGHLANWRAKYADSASITTNGEYPTFSLPDGTQVDWPAYEAHLQDNVSKAYDTLLQALQMQSMLDPFELRSEFGV